MATKFSPILTSTNSTIQKAVDELQAVRQSLTPDQALEMVRDAIDVQVAELNRHAPDEQMRVVSKLAIALPW